MIALSDTAVAVKRIGISLSSEFADTAAYVKLMKCLNSNKGSAHLTNFLRRLKAKGIDTKKLAKWPKEVVEDLDTKSLSLTKDQFEALHSKITALDDAGLHAKYGIKSIGEAETAHKILVRHADEAASLSQAEFQAVYTLETRSPGIIDELAGSTQLSGAENLKKVAELETRSEGMVSALKNIMNKEGAQESIDITYGLNEATAIQGAEKILTKGKTLNNVGGGLPKKKLKTILRSLGKTDNNWECIKDAIKQLPDSLTVDDVEDLMLKYVDTPGVGQNIERIPVHNVGNVKGSINELLTADAFENAGYKVNRFNLEGNIDYVDPITNTPVNGHYEFDISVSGNGKNILVDAKSGTLNIDPLTPDGEKFIKQLARLKAVSGKTGAEAQLIVTQSIDMNVLTYIKGLDINVFMRQGKNLIEL